MGDDVMENSSMDFWSLIKMGGALVAFLATLAGIFLYLDSTYVRSDIYSSDKLHYEQEMAELEDTTARLIEAIEEDRERDQNEIMKAIKDSTAVPLIVRRDILLARGNLAPEEQAELNVLNQKLQELNVNN
jgi:hypothetical protein